MTIRRTATLALLLSAMALPALADCPGHDRVKQDQSAQTQTDRPAVPVATSS